MLFYKKYTNVPPHELLYNLFSNVDNYGLDHTRGLLTPLMNTKNIYLMLHDAQWFRK